MSRLPTTDRFFLGPIEEWILSAVEEKILKLFRRSRALTARCKTCAQACPDDEYGYGYKSAVMLNCGGYPNESIPCDPSWPKDVQENYYHTLGMRYRQSFPGCKRLGAVTNAEYPSATEVNPNGACAKFERIPLREALRRHRMKPAADSDLMPSGPMK